MVALRRLRAAHQASLRSSTHGGVCQESRAGGAGCILESESFGGGLAALPESSTTAV
jgi:hypothetical protein